MSIEAISYLALISTLEIQEAHKVSTCYSNLDSLASLVATVVYMACMT